MTQHPQQPYQPPHRPYPQQGQPQGHPGPSQQYGQSFGGPGPYGQPGNHPPMQQHPGQQPGHPGWGHQPAERKRFGAPQIFTVLGVVTILASVILGVFLATGIGRAIPSEEEMIQVVGTTEVDVDEDGLLLYAERNATLRCGITDPDGQPSSGRVPDQRFSNQQGEFRAIGVLGGDGAPTGTYTVECEGDGAVVAPALEVGALLGGIGGILLAVFGSLLGATLLIIGVVWGVVRSRRR